MTEIFIHADDYGISPYNSGKYIELLNDRKLDSISIIANTQYAKECAVLLNEKRKELSKCPRISVHLNFIDGYSLSTGKVNRLSWTSLFFSSFSSIRKRNAMKEQLKKEIYMQIERTKRLYSLEGKICIDSHMHTHMIPIVADALMEVIDECHIPVEFVRVAREPLHLFFKCPSLLFSYNVVNLVKNILLNLLAYRITRQLKERDISYGYLLGVMTSGNMNIERIKRILPHFIAYAEKQNRILEVLFHPGQMREEEVGIAQNKKSVTEFYLSNNRNVEWECINGLEEYI